MRGLTSTLILVLALAGLGAYIYFVDSKKPEPGLGGDPKTKVFAVEADKIDEVRVTAGGETSLVRKADGMWKMIEPTATEADQTELSTLTSAIAGLEMSRTVDENASSLAEYGLEKPGVLLEFKAAGNVSGSVGIGDKTATQSDLYAAKNGTKQVFLIAAYQESTFSRKPFDLRDKKILKFDRDKADLVSMTRGAESIELSREGSEWKVAKPVTARSDYATVEGLLTRLSTSSMSKLLEADAKDLAKYGLDKPAMTLIIGAGSSRTVLEVGRTENDQTYARDQSRPLVFTVDTTLQADLKKPFDDYRRKEFFEFRPFFVDKLRIVGAAQAGPKIYNFEKTKAATSTDPDVWKVTPEGGTARDVDSAKMDDLLSKLTALKASAFVDAKTKTGLDTPEIVVSASYDGGKFERVRIGKVGTDAFGAREGESGAGRIEQASMADALQALDAVVSPPPPPAAPVASGQPGDKPADKPAEKK